MDEGRDLAGALASIDGRLAALELALATLWRKVAPDDPIAAQLSWREVADVLALGDGNGDGAAGEHERLVAEHMREAWERLRRLELAMGGGADGG